MSQVIELTYPILDAEEEIKSLNLRRPTVRDILVMDAVVGNIQKSVRMIAQLSDLPVEVIETMDAHDFAKVSEVVSDFLE